MATTAGGDGKALSHGGASAAIRVFPRWGLALRVPIFICDVVRFRCIVAAETLCAKNAHLVIPQPVFTGGICFFLGIRAKTTRVAGAIFINL
jgi:hypothetical protein